MENSGRSSDGKHHGNHGISKDQKSTSLVKAGVHMKAVFWLGIMFLMQISWFTLQAIKNLYAHFRYLCFGPFCKFFGDF